MRSAARLLAALVGVLALIVAAPAPAFAHNVLISTTPADRSSVPAAPASVLLTFDQPALAMGTQLRVIGPGSAVVSAGPAILVNATVRQDLAGPLAAGRYTVEWRVTSADGHPVSGEFTFTSTATGQGKLAASTLSAHPGSTGSSGSSGSSRSLPPSTTVVVALAVLVVGVAAVVLTLVVRRRRRGRRHDRSEA